MVVLFFDVDLVNSRPKRVRATAYSGCEEEDATQHAQGSALDGRLHKSVSDTEEVIREFRELTSNQIQPAGQSVLSFLVRDDLPVAYGTLTARDKIANGLDPTLTQRLPLFHLQLINLSLLSRRSTTVCRCPERKVFRWRGRDRPRLLRSRGSADLRV